MKKIIIALGIVAFYALAYLLFDSARTPVHNMPSSNSIANLSEASSSPPVFLETINFFSGIQYFEPDISSIVDSSTGMAVFLKNFTGENTGGGYSANIYVNNKYIGKTSGLGFSQVSFSSDNKYLAIRFIDYAGSVVGVEDSYIDVIDLINLTNNIITLAKLKESLEGNYQDNKNQFADIAPYMESFTWHGDTALDMTLYLVGSVYNQQTKQVTYYRISPKQIWQYDLITRQYSFFKTLPETSSTND